MLVLLAIFFLGATLGGSPSARRGAERAPTRFAVSDSVCFDGEVGTGVRARRVILALAGDAGTVTSGTVWLYGRPARSLSVAVSVVGASLRAASSDTTARLELRTDWAPDALALRGTIARGTDTSAAVLRRTARRDDQAARDDAWATGDWSGVIVARGIPVRLGLRIEPGPCGTLVGVLDSPDQGQTGLPLTAVRATAESLTVRLDYMDASVTIARQGADSSAVFVQRGERMPFTARRGVRLTETRRPQEPARPYPYIEREARFEHRRAGIRLAGTLTIPPARGPHPALLLISGSGAQDRDETVAGHRPFLVLADFLTRRGFAVLRVDDRGAGASTGNVLVAGLDDLAGDVAAGLAYLRAQPEVDARRIGLVGHSEGGYVATVVAARDTGVAFVVLLAAPAAPGRAVFVAQRSVMARAAGTPPDDVAVDSLILARIFEVLDTRPRDDELEARVDAAIEALLRELPPARGARARAMLASRSAAQDSTSLALWRSAWFRSFYHHDPQPFLRRLRIPVLAIYGERDLQVPPDQSVPLLEAAVSRRLTLRRIPELNHLMQRATTGLMREYVEIEETIAPLVLETIGDWLAHVAGNPRPLGVPAPDLRPTSARNPE